MNKVLVTGGAGFIGYALVYELLKRGFEVDVIDDLSIGEEAKIHPSTNFFKLDIRDIDKFKDTSYDYIFHLAALSRIQLSFSNPNLVFSVNVEGTKKVVEYAYRNKCKLIYAGSSSKHHIPTISPYAISKHMGEEWIKMYKKVYGLNTQIVRFYNVYGPGELVDSHMAAVIGLWRGQIQKNYPITIIGDGKQRRDFTHIDDIVEGLIMIAESDSQHNDAWELGTGKSYSINDVANMFIERFNCVKVYMNEQQGNYRETIRVNDDALNILGWKPKDRLTEYINQIKNGR